MNPLSRLDSLDFYGIVRSGGSAKPPAYSLGLGAVHPGHTSLREVPQVPPVHLHGFR